MYRRLSVCGKLSHHKSSKGIRTLEKSSSASIIRKDRESPADYSVFHLDEQVLEVSKQADVAVAQTVSLRCFRDSLVKVEELISSIGRFSLS